MRGNTAGWGSLEVVGSLLAGALFTAAFVAWQLRAREPMLPMRFLRSRAFAAGNAGIFLALASLFGAVFLVAQYFQAALGYGPLETGLRMLPWTSLVMFVAPLTRALADRFGERPFMVGGLIWQAIGMGWIALIAEPCIAYGELVIPLLLSGAGIAMAIIVAQSSVVGSVVTDAVGKASGTNTMMRELGGVFGIAIAVAVFASAGSYATPEGSPTGLRRRWEGGSDRAGTTTIAAIADAWRARPPGSSGQLRDAKRSGDGARSGRGPWPWRVARPRGRPRRQR